MGRRGRDPSRFPCSPPDPSPGGRAFLKDESSSVAGRERSNRRATGPILAVSSSGTITKVNSQARRAFGAEAPAEREQLGWFLGRLMLGREVAPRQLVLSVLDEDETHHEVLLVPSDEEPAWDSKI